MLGDKAGQLQLSGAATAFETGVSDFPPASDRVFARVEFQFPGLLAATADVSGHD
jgi:hypothetical protein